MSRGRPDTSRRRRWRSRETAVDLTRSGWAPPSCCRNAGTRHYGGALGWGALREEGPRSLAAAGPFLQAHVRRPRSSEDSEMFTHAACLLLRQELLGALAKPTEIARPLARPFFGWPRGRTT